MPRTDSQKLLHRVGPDGVQRLTVEDQRINEALATCFKGEAGAAALAYLKSITVHRVLGPEASDAHLRHHEGMRFVVAIIESRIAQDQHDRSNPPGGDPAKQPARPRLASRVSS